MLRINRRSSSENVPDIVTPELLWPLAINASAACRFAAFVCAQAIPVCGRSTLKGEFAMGAPSPELCNLWLARAFNANDVDAAVAMYHPDASIVQVDQVHGGTRIARGADGIRETMAAYIGLKPHMDVVTHHTTISGDFAMTRSQWLIRGTAKDGSTTTVHHHGMEVHRKLPDGTWAFFIDHPFGADSSWAVAAPPPTE